MEEQAATAYAKASESAQEVLMLTRDSLTCGTCNLNIDIIDSLFCFLIK